MIGEYCLCNPKQVELLQRIDTIATDLNSQKYYDNVKKRRLVGLEVFLNPRVGSTILDIIIFDGFSGESMRITFHTDQIEDFEECVETVRIEIKNKFCLD